MTHRPTDPFSATAAPADTTAARRPRVAVIGTGISGMGAAYLLHTATTDTGAPRFDVTIYEKNAYIGGHSRTIDVPVTRQQAPEKQALDTGFIVLNDRNYPNLLGLFRHLGVAIEKSDMSFGARIDSAATSAQGTPRSTPLEYGSKNLFAQKSNLFRPKFWGMIVDILRFNRSAGKILKDAEKDPSLHNKTMGQYIKDLDMGEWFRDYYLLAMGAAIWSCPAKTMLDFPATTFIRFFENHGLLTINGHPQWYTVTGGSRSYVAKLTAAYKGHIRLNCGVVSVAQAKDGTKILHDSQGNESIYDLVVFACHADEALAMIAEPDASEQSVLGAFRYQENRVVVHTDASFMPRNKGAWASWVYLSDDSNAARKSSTVSLSYWMNNLQNFTSHDPVLVTLNPHREPRKNTVLDEHVFSHPVFDRAAIAAQGKIAALQGHNGFYYCGAYQQYGFHEDGILSAVRMAATMGITPPWA